MGLPFLPSLVAGPAYGADPTFVRRPIFLALTSQHGGVLESAMFPPDSALTEQQDLYPGHVIRRGPLVGRTEGTDKVLSTVLRAPATRLTDKLIGKLSLLRGLDIPWDIAHHTGGYLGNYSRNDRNDLAGQAMPTIDHLIAYSPTFYPSLAGIRERSMVTDFIHARVSWGFSSPTSRTGTIQGFQNASSPGDLFTRIFVPPTSTGPAPPPPRKPIADLVLENYRRLRTSNRRLSSSDKQRLDDHVERLQEIQRRMTLTSGTPSNAASCKDAKKPANGGEDRVQAPAFIDAMAAAFACGTSRVGVVGIYDPGIARDNDVHYHQEVAHRHTASDAQPILQETNRVIFSQIFVHAMNALDVEEQPGVTLLDNALVSWCNESGQDTHNARSIPLLLAGGAAGAMKSGQYIDYRNRTSRVNGGPSGLMWNQWLATAMQLMGLPRSEFQAIRFNGTTGYGNPRIDSGFATSYVSGVRDNASEILPFLKA